MVEYRVTEEGRGYVLVSGRKLDEVALAEKSATIFDGNEREIIDIERSMTRCAEGMIVATENELVDTFIELVVMAWNIDIKSPRDPHILKALPAYIRHRAQHQ